MQIDIAAIERQYAEMSEAEFLRLRRADLVAAVRPSYDRECGRRGVLPPLVERADPAALLAQIKKRNLTKIVAGIIHIVLSAAVLLSNIYGLLPSITYGLLPIFIVSFVGFAIAAPARGDSLVLWLRRFHVKRPHSLPFSRVLSSACQGLAFPLTVQDSTFRRSHHMAISQISIWLPLLILVCFIPIFIVPFVSSGALNPTQILLFVCIPLAAFAGAILLFVYRRLSYIRLNPANARRKTQQLIKIIHAKGGLHSEGVFVVRCDDSFWKDTVELCLASTAVAVIDVTEVSDNVTWELETALRLIGPESIVLAYGVAAGAPKEIDEQRSKQLSDRLGRDCVKDAQIFFYPLTRKQWKTADWSNETVVANDLQAMLAIAITYSQYRVAMQEGFG